MAGTERQGEVDQGEEDTATRRAGDGDRGRCARSGHARRCAARRRGIGRRGGKGGVALAGRGLLSRTRRSEEHTSELQSLMRISYAVFCLKKKKTTRDNNKHQNTYRDKKQQ